MGRSNYFRRGQWNAICDQCGGQFKSSQLMLQWNGLMVCHQCWEPRNAQEFLKIRAERPIPWSRPEQPAFPSGAVTVNRFIDDVPINATWIG